MKTTMKISPSKTEAELKQLAESRGVKEHQVKNFHCFILEMKMLQLRMDSLVNSPLITKQMKNRFKLMSNYVGGIERELIGNKISSEELVESYVEVSTALTGVTDVIATWKPVEIDQISEIASYIKEEGLEIEQQ